MAGYMAGMSSREHEWFNRQAAFTAQTTHIIGQMNLLRPSADL